MAPVNDVADTPDLPLCFQKILTNHFYFFAVKCRKANDGDEDVKSEERWPIIAWAMLERPVIVRAIGDVARRHTGHWRCGPSSYGPWASGQCNDGPLGRWPVVVRATYGPRERGPSLFETRGGGHNKAKEEVNAFFNPFVFEKNYQQTILLS